MNQKQEYLQEDWLTSKGKAFFYVLGFLYIWTFFMWGDGEYSLGFYFFALPMTAWKIWDWTKALVKWAFTQSPGPKEALPKIQGQ